MSNVATYSHDSVVGEAESADVTLVELVNGQVEDIGGVPDSHTVSTVLPWEPDRLYECLAHTQQVQHYHGNQTAYMSTWLTHSKYSVTMETRQII